MDPKIVESELRNHKIREGPIYKRTKFLQEWRERWMVLTMNYILIFSNRNLKELAQFIDLRQVKTYKSYLRKEEDMIPAGFKIRTLEDMFYFCARNCNEKWTWLVSLERLMDFKYAGKSPYNNAEWIKTKGFMSQREFERGKFDQPQFEAPPQPQKIKEAEKPKQQELELKSSQTNNEQLTKKLKQVEEELQNLKIKEEEMQQKERQQQQIFLFELNKLKKTEQSLKELQIQVQQRAREAERIIAAASDNSALKEIVERASEEARQSGQPIPSIEEVKVEEAIKNATEQVQKAEQQATETTIEQPPPPEETAHPQQVPDKELETKIEEPKNQQQKTQQPKKEVQPEPQKPQQTSPSISKTGISKRIADMKNFFESKKTVMGSGPAMKKEEKKVEKKDEAVSLHMCRDRVVVNLLEQFHPKAYNYPGLRYIIEFLVTICAERTLGYQSFLIREAKAHQNRFLFAEVLLELINDYKKYDEFVCIAKIVEVLIFEAPGIFKLNHFDLIKRKLVDLVNHAPENHSDMPTLLKTLYVVHKMKNLEKSEAFKEKLASISEKMISVEGKNWARKLIEDL